MRRTGIINRFLAGADEIQSNSFISPNSAGRGDLHEGSIYQKKTATPSLESHITSDIKTWDEVKINPSKSQNERVARSADPIISKTSDVDRFIMYKNIEEALDSNDVELSGRLVNISPSKTEQNILNHIQSSTTVHFSGEDKRAPQARSLEEPLQISPTATIPHQSSATLSTHQGKARQVNPDIQDIITGIVKLLNGNVNVQANTLPAMGRPLRPLSSRINNRGPPRITDLPALPPDFDVPAPPLPPPPLGQMPPPAPSSSPTRMPTPYPFDLPPPSSSPVRPFGDHVIGNKRPGIYRPTIIPPWDKRYSQRRPGMGNRRPTSIPPYKPLPSDFVSLTSEKPMEDILNLDLGSHLGSSHESVENENITQKRPTTEPSSIELEQPEVTTNLILESSESILDKETIEFEKNKEKISKKDKYSSKTTSVTPTTPLPSSLSSVSKTMSAINSKPINNTSSLFNSTIILQNTDSTTSTVENNTTSKEVILTPTKSFTKITSTSVVNIISNIMKSNESMLNSSPTIESSISEVSSNSKEDSSNLKTPTSELLPLTSAVNISKVSDFPQNNSTNIHSSTNHSLQGFSYYPYRPRPGIVLDDTEYKPGGSHRHPIVTRPPIGQLGDIFDITVSAIQGPGGSSGTQGKPYIIPVDIEKVHVGQDVITSPQDGNGFVSIDGKRTYLNLFGEVEPTTTSAEMIKPSGVSHNQVTGTGYAIAEPVEKKPSSIKPTQSQRRPLYGRPKPTHPPVRIDTCIVGDDTTCDVSQHEKCLTENGVSACHCRPGFTRRKHRDICRKIVSVLLSLRVDRIYERRIVWANELGDRNSDSYQQLAYEAERALESAMSMTPFSDEFLGVRVNGIYSGERSAGQAGVFVNLTLQLEENSDTSRPTVRGDIQKHLLGVIQRRSNNVGNSALWVESPLDQYLIYKIWMNVLLLSFMTATNLLNVQMSSVDSNVNAEKDIEINILRAGIEQGGIVNNVLVNIVTIEGIANTRMDKKCANVLEIITATNVNWMVRFLVLPLERV
ncbi:hypothetical protein WA026_017568 [Henosepilachna vigintioctopunctata]|uniref:SEA domain-containing protein n=1 Tax=Henosepilachna vigintioctopunctata TaxID=420089 RepID=A0AAW1UT44_9CUCU